jgi:glycosyltransferase involved in cell wall biosynthesis
MKVQIPLTFVIPSYGRQQKLERAVNSILEQDVWPVEVLVIDDASPEPLVLSERTASTGIVRIVRLDANGGAGNARNVGLEIAKTEWVSFLDSDDWLLPGTMEARWAYLDDAEKHCPVPGRTVYGCGWLDVLPSGVLWQERVPLPASTPDEFFRGCWFAPGSCIILNRAEIMNAAGGSDVSLRRLEDYEWFVRIALANFELKIQDMIGVAVERGNNTNLVAVTNASAYIRHKIASLTKDKSLRKTADAYLFYERAASAWRERRLASFLWLITASLLSRPRIKLSPLPGWRVRRLR